MLIGGVLGEGGVMTFQASFRGAAVRRKGFTPTPLSVSGKCHDKINFGM